MMQMQMNSMQLMQAMLKAGGAPGGAPAAPVEQAMPSPMPMPGTMGGGMPDMGLPALPAPVSSGEASSASAPEKSLGPNIPAAFRNMNKGEKVGAPPAVAPAVAPVAPALGGCAGMAGLVQNPAMAKAAMAAQAAQAAQAEAQAAAAAKAAAKVASSSSVDKGAMSLEGMQDMLAAGAEFNPMLAMMMKQQALIQAQFAQAERETPKQQEQSNEKDLRNDPDILELFDHFVIDNRHHQRFCNIMSKRLDTFESDMIKLWELCEQARVPEGMFVSKMREMEEGTFVGKTVPDKELKELSKKFKLDHEAESKLSDVLAKYDKDRRRQYMEELEKHLETSSRPSAMVMMSLKKLGNGEPLGKPGRPAPGCYLERMQREQRDRGRRRSRSRSRSGSRDRRGGKGKGRGGRSRSRSRDRNRGRSRSRSRDRR